jgi:hypothetical protein
MTIHWVDFWHILRKASTTSVVLRAYGEFIWDRIDSHSSTTTRSGVSEYRASASI